MKDLMGWMSSRGCRRLLVGVLLQRSHTLSGGECEVKGFALGSSLSH